MGKTISVLFLSALRNPSQGRTSLNVTMIPTRSRERQVDRQLVPTLLAFLNLQTMLLRPLLWRSPPSQSLQCRTGPRPGFPPASVTGASYSLEDCHQMVSAEDAPHLVEYSIHTCRNCCITLFCIIVFLTTTLPPDASNIFYLQLLTTNSEPSLSSTAPLSIRSS